MGDLVWVSARPPNDYYIVIGKITSLFAAMDYSEAVFLRFALDGPGEPPTHDATKGHNLSKMRERFERVATTSSAIPEDLVIRYRWYCEQVKSLRDFRNEAAHSFVRLYSNRVEQIGTYYVGREWFATESFESFVARLGPSVRLMEKLVQMIELLRVVVLSEMYGLNSVSPPYSMSPHVWLACGGGCSVDVRCDQHKGWDVHKA